MQGELFGLAEMSELGSVEEALRARGVRSVIGVDEAGRGPLAGPVHAGAYFWDLDAREPDWFEEINDSKKLKEPRREALYGELMATAPERCVVALRDAAVIDEINILQATFGAMREAVELLVEQMGTPDLVLVDGNLEIPGLELAQRPLVKGDSRSRIIGAASILAKVSRDRMMKEAAKRWPEYGFESNKGYGSRAHRDALLAHGPCPIHRLSFGGVVGVGGQGGEGR